MPLSDHALGDLGFAVGNNGSTGQQTSLDNCAAGDQTEVRMSEFTVNGVDSITGDNTLGEGASGGGNVSTGPFNGGGDYYTYTVNGAGSEFNRIQNTNQAWGWSVSSNMEQANSPDDYDAYCLITGEGTTNQSVTGTMQDEYNYSSNSLTKNINVDPHVTIDNLSYQVDDNDNGSLSFEFTDDGSSFTWRLINVSDSPQNQIASNTVFGDGVHGGSFSDPYTESFSDYVEIRIRVDATGAINTQQVLAG